jgi:hypothetical protein
MAVRAADPDGRRVKRMDGPSTAERQAALMRLIDAGLPTGSQVLLESDDTDPPAHEEPDGEHDDGGRLPFVTDSFLLDATRGILTRHATSFGAQWHADPERLCAEAKALLQRFGCAAAVPGGVLVLPLTGRYRNTVAETKARRTAPRSS